MYQTFRWLLVFFVLPWISIGSGAYSAEQPESTKPMRILFLGDKGSHRPAERAAQLIPVLAKRGIVIEYTENLDDLDPKKLARFDGLLIYANTTKISPRQEKALLDFVEQGKGLIPIHCASYCFLNSEKYIALVGAQFKQHGTGVFDTRIEKPNHPIMKGFSGFRSWDETYEHHRHNDKDRIVLSYREREPWTWIRTQGKGRVFYTAWGHDQRTWSNRGFHNLVERGIRWAVGEDPGVVPEYAADSANGFPIPQMTPNRTDVKPFEYVEVGNKIPNYTPGKRWGTLGKPITKMQKPLVAEESLKHFVTPTDFEVRLFACEPDIGKPICLAWDERGRLWLAETVDYPNELQPKGQGRDRIRICEDTDDDGKADKFTIFAEKLSIPTSLTFSNGGIIVHQAPETLFLADTDGDDKADIRKVLFSGWSTGDTHAGPSNLRYGLDNWIWGMQGYAGFNAKVGDDRHRFSAGFYRFSPDGSSMEFLRSTNNNTWGLGFSEEGVVFGSTANRNPSVYMPIPNRYYESVFGWSAERLGGIAENHLFEPITDRVRQVDHHGGYTAGAGHALYTARTYPREYWNRTAFVCGPTGHLVGTFVLDRNGADFRSKNAFNLLASDDEWSAPIVAEVGPDGNVWVVDWYNYIVQHNPTPAGFKTGKGNAYLTDLRDKKHGRVYRVVYKKAKPSKSFSLSKAKPEQLLEALTSDNMLWRLHAQRLLVERGKLDVLPELVEIASDKSEDAIGLNTSVIHALWTLHGLGAMDDAHPDALRAAVAALKHVSAGVRRNAVQVLPPSPSLTKAILDADLLDDADAQVRLAALLALAEAPTNRDAAKAVVTMLCQPQNYTDSWILDAATSAAAKHDLTFLAELASLKDIPARVQQVLPRVAEHLARRRIEKGMGTLLKSLETAQPATAEAIVQGLARSWPKDHRPMLDDDAERALVALLVKLPSSGKGQLIRLARAWGSESLDKYAIETVKAMFARLEDTKLDDAERAKMAKQLVAFVPNDEAMLERLMGLIVPNSSPTLVQGLLEAAGSSQSPKVGEAILQKVGQLTPSLKSVAFRVLFLRPTTTRALLDAIEAGKLRPSDLALDQQRALTSHPTQQIATRAKKLFAKSGGLPNPDREKILREYLSVTEEEGDANIGKGVFKEHCMKCHMHSGEGAKIGPDLTGMAVHPKEELLVQILDPSRSLEGNYRSYTIETADGLVLSGMLGSETKTTLEIIDVEGKKHVVQREDIEQLIASDKSLMPEGFEKQLKRDDFKNLLAFLTQRGKFLPLDIAKAATIVSTRGMFYDEHSTVERLIFPDWKPKTFQGVPFLLVDPRGDQTPNVIMLHGPQGKFPPKMPKSVRLSCNAPAKALHFLSGVSGWGAKRPLDNGTVSMVVRLHYKDGKTEEHPLVDGRHFADYIGPFEVPDSKLAFKLRGRQIRYFAVLPKRNEVIESVELVKGDDRTSPIVMAITLEGTE